jgi:PIN domain nuclease of toxin-antitoxin system
LRLLLDTHVVLSWMGHGRELSDIAQRELEDATNQMLVSAVVAWEIAIKRAVRKLQAPADVVTRLLATTAVELPVSIEHAAAVERLPHHHADPFDRMLVAQARIEGATLVTGDAALRAYDVPILW